MYIINDLKSDLLGFLAIKEIGLLLNVHVCSVGKDIIAISLAVYRVKNFCMGVSNKT